MSWNKKMIQGMFSTSELNKKIYKKIKYLLKLCDYTVALDYNVKLLKYYFSYANDDKNVL